jgi:predicted ATPase
MRSSASDRPIRRVDLDPATTVDRSAWWSRIPAVRAVLDHGLNLPAGVTFLVGENGSGKSTLIEGLAAAIGLNPEGGSKGARYSTRPSESPLGDVLRVTRGVGSRGYGYFLRAETMHGLYTYLEQNPSPYGPNLDAKLHEKSHGEGFLDVLDRKFGGRGFFLMDEPEAALSFTSTLSLIARLADLRAEGAQLVVATHSPLLTALPGATILELGDFGLRKSPWDQLTIVATWRRFLTDPPTFLGPLLKP